MSRYLSGVEARQRAPDAHILASVLEGALARLQGSSPLPESYGTSSCRETSSSSDKQAAIAHPLPLFIGP